MAVITLLTPFFGQPNQGTKSTARVNQMIATAVNEGTTAVNTLIYLLTIVLIT